MTNVLQQRPIHMAQGRPVRSALLKRTLPAFAASKDPIDYLAGDQHGEAISREGASRRFGSSDQRTGPRSPFEDEIDSVLTTVGAQSSLREVLYKTLVFCEIEHEFSEVENFILNTPEARFSHLSQNPYTLIHMLADAQGLFFRGIDGAGSDLVGEDYSECTSKELQVESDVFFVKTSEAGIEAASLIDPRRRFEALMAHHPHRAHTYRAFMRYLQQPRALSEITAFYENDSDLAHDVVRIHHVLSADFYIDRLEKAGVAVWIGAWRLSEAGEEILAGFDA